MNWAVHIITSILKGISIVQNVVIELMVETIEGKEDKKFGFHLLY